MTTEEKQATYAEVVRFRAGLPEHVLKAYVLSEAWEDSTDRKTRNDWCAFCRYVTDPDDGPPVDQCVHYDNLMEAFKRSGDIKARLTEEEQDLADWAKFIE